MRTRSRQPAHRCTTANFQAAYPFVSEGGLGSRGVYIGQDMFGGSFTYDPWELYGRVLSGPNMLVIGQIGFGKSAFVKSYVWRQLVFGRRAVMLDPKGENGPLCAAVGVEPLRLVPGGSIRLNPLDPKVGDPDRPAEQVLQDQLTVLQAIIAASLLRPLTPEERAACHVALVAATQDNEGEPTLPHVVEALLHPSQASAERLATDPVSLARASREAALELQRLCEGDLRGMFDGPTSGNIDLTAPLVSFDLSAVYQSEALGILMVCAAAWLQRALARPEPTKRILVLDEAWVCLRNVAIARWLQSSYKLARAYGVQNVAVVHRISDLSAAGTSDSEQVQLARGLLSDSETRVIYYQAPGDVAGSKDVLGLTDSECELVPTLRRGQALWKVGKRSFLVQHRLSPAEFGIIDTDSRMVNGAEAPLSITELPGGGEGAPEPAQASPAVTATPS
jgi:type IV secretory pathway VirB4 component